VEKKSKKPTEQAARKTFIGKQGEGGKRRQGVVKSRGVGAERRRGDIGIVLLREGWSWETQEKGAVSMSTLQGLECKEGGKVHIKGLGEDGKQRNVVLSRKTNN